MMAARFRSVTWVGVALVPALACYLVTQHVAAERAELAKVERHIGQTRRAIRDLQTELGTRGSMAQIERWNGQTFALSAPTAEQFIAGDVQLASLTALPAAPHPVIAVAATAPAPAATPLPTMPATAPVAEVRQAAFHPAVPAAASAPAEVRVTKIRDSVDQPNRRAGRQIEQAAAPVADRQPLLRQATYMKPAYDPARAAPTKVALMSHGPLDARTLADIGRIASAERGGRRP
jgi:hypothetical protein